MSKGEREPRACATCDGKGFLHLTRCVPCNGHGHVLVYQPFVKCPHCNGDGRHQPSDQVGTEYCAVCQGRGWALSVAVEGAPRVSRGGE